MYTSDLFGKKVPVKSAEQKYNEYMASAQWKRKRAQALERAGHRCEICGVTRWSAKLEVHHKTYERFGHELPEDLQVLCEKCHKSADEKREKEARIRAERRREEALWDARFRGWARKTFGEKWELAALPQWWLEEEFDKFLERVESDEW